MTEEIQTNENADRMEEELLDDRKIPIFIKSDVDDLGLTLEAFRVYGHLARRAGSNNKAWPSYVSIGEHCFRGSYPNSSPASLKAKAIAAVSELVAYGLIRKEVRKREEGGNKANIYRLTETGFCKPKEPLESCNVRKGKPNQQRQNRENSQEGVSGDSPPVNGDNPSSESKAVNGDNPPRLTGITPPVNGDNPKVFPLKVLPSEGTPSHTQNATSALKPSEPEQPVCEVKPERPEQPQQPVPEDNSLPVKVKRESSSAAKDPESDQILPPRFSPAKENTLDLNAQSWPVDFPWRLDQRTLHPKMEQAVFQINNGWKLVVLPDGKINRPSIERHVSKLEGNSRILYSDTTIAERKKLLAYWDYAQSLIKAEQQIETARAEVEDQSSPSPVNTSSDEPVRPSDEPKNQITPETRKMLDEGHKMLARINRERWEREQKAKKDRYR